jgi:multiple sugar transport system permease protein
MNRDHALKVTRRALLYAVLILTSLVMAFPLLFGVAGSIAATDDYARTPWFPIPYHPTFLNYYLALGGTNTVSTSAFGSSTTERKISARDTPSGDVPRWALNTIIRAAWYIIIPAVCAVMAGYVFAKMRFKGRDAVFIYLLSSMMLPGIVFLVPTFVMMARFPLAGGNNILGQGGSGFINQWPALLITGLVNVFFIFMFRQTLLSIPSDFEEAARVDGANTLQCIFRIYLPMLMPTITVLVIFQFVAIWNEYIWPLFVSAGNPSIWTISLGFQALTAAGNALKGLPASTTDYPFTFALATVSMAPLIVLFFIMQRYFVEGVQGFAIKG